MNQKAFKELKTNDKFAFAHGVDGVFEKLDGTKAKCILGSSWQRETPIDCNPEAIVILIEIESESKKETVELDENQNLIDTLNVQINNVKQNLIDTLNVQLDKVKQDLIDRNSIVSAVVILDQETGNHKVLTYDRGGTLSSISSEYPIIKFYGAEFNNGGIYSIVSVYAEKALEKSRMKKAMDEANVKTQEKEPKKGFGFIRRFFRW